MQVNPTQEGLVLHLILPQPSCAVPNDALEPKLWQVASHFFICHLLGFPMRYKHLVFRNIPAEVIRSQGCFVGQFLDQ